jgi:hypothetical protein
VALRLKIAAILSGTFTAFTVRIFFHAVCASAWPKPRRAGFQIRSLARAIAMAQRAECEGDRARMREKRG